MDHSHTARSLTASRGAAGFADATGERGCCVVVVVVAIAHLRDFAPSILEVLSANASEFLVLVSSNLRLFALDHIDEVVDLTVVKAGLTSETLKPALRCDSVNASCNNCDSTASVSASWNSWASFLADCVSFRFSVAAYTDAASTPSLYLFDFLHRVSSCIASSSLLAPSMLFSSGTKQVTISQTGHILEELVPIVKTDLTIT